MRQCRTCGPSCLAGGSACDELLSSKSIQLDSRDYAPRPAHLKWLLDSDAAIRWQVMRDLTDDALDAIAAQRSRVATEAKGLTVPDTFEVTF